MNSKIEIIEEYITKYQAQNLRLKKLLSEQEHSMDERVTAICRDFMQVFDAFDKAEEAIHERGYDQSRLSTQAIQRLLVAKAKLADVLSNYGVQSINLQGLRPKPDVAQVVGVEHDDNQEPGTVIRIEHEGFMRGDEVLRKADVVVAADDSGSAAPTENE